MTQITDFERAINMTAGMPAHWSQSRKISLACENIERDLSQEIDDLNDKRLAYKLTAAEVAKHDSLIDRMQKLQADKVAHNAKPAAPSFVDDFETLSNRRREIEAQMNEATSVKELNACVDELLAIDCKLAPFEQIGDARLMMKYGGGL